MHAPHLLGAQESAVISIVTFKFSKTGKPWFLLNVTLRFISSCMWVWAAGPNVENDSVLEHKGVWTAQQLAVQRDGLREAERSWTGSKKWEELKQPKWTNKQASKQTNKILELNEWIGGSQSFSAKCQIVNVSCFPAHYSLCCSYWALLFYSIAWKQP